MIGCKNFQGQIAAALYEPLTDDEQGKLDAHLEHCPNCQKAAAELQSLVELLPTTDVAFEGDLRPVLAERLREEGQSRSFLRKPWFAPLCATFGVFVVAVGLWQGGVLGPELAPKDAPGVVAGAPVDPVLIAYLEEADTKVAEGDFTGALTPLKLAVETSAGRTMGGEVLLKLADVQFLHLRRYADAYTTYDQFRTAYTDSYSAQPETIARFELLAEVRDQDYAPLYALDAARESAGDPFAALEEMVAMNAGKIIAEVAVSAMHDLVRYEDASSDKTPEDVLQKVRARCTNPIAIAQVDLALGDSYALHDAATARSFYESVAEGGAEALAYVAQQRIADQRVEATAP